MWFEWMIWGLQVCSNKDVVSVTEYHRRACKDVVGERDEFNLGKIKSRYLGHTLHCLISHHQ